MQFVKVIGLAAVAAAALMAFAGAGTASATVVCSTNTNPCTSKWPVGTKLSFSLKESSAKLVTTDEKTTLDTCTASTAEGEVSNAGSSTTTVTGPVTSVTAGGCTFPTSSTQLSKLEAHVGTAPNGTLTADGEFRVTFNSVLFGSCVYGVSAGASLGTVTGGAAATFTANAVAKKSTGSEAACPETSKWTAKYTSTGATALNLETS